MSIYFYLKNVCGCGRCICITDAHFRFPSIAIAISLSLHLVYVYRLCAYINIDLLYLILIWWCPGGGLSCGIMPVPADKPYVAVGCGVCDTPELWRGAAGLCTCTRVCWCPAESLHSYTTSCTYYIHDIHHTYTHTQYIHTLLYDYTI